MLLSLLVALGSGYRGLPPLHRVISTAPRLSMSSDNHTPVEQLGIVTMYKKESCPYCKKARDLLETKYSLRINYVDVEEPDQ